MYLYRYSGIYQCFLPILILKDPDLIKQITVKDFDHFTDHRSFFPEDVDPLWGKNLFSLKGKYLFLHNFIFKNCKNFKITEETFNPFVGQKWRDMRTILSPSFTSSKMKSLFVLISECAENFVKHFLEKSEGVVTIEFKDTFTRFTNDVIASAAFGIQVDSLGQPKNQFYVMGKEATDFSSTRKILKILTYIMFPKICKVGVYFVTVLHLLTISAK